MASLVSVITIVFNGGRHIEQTIQSVLGQTHPNVEYIIIDGGSTDNTVEIIKKYEHLLAYWTSERDRGISDAFNKGLAKANGEWVGIINADDWYERDAIARVAENGTSADIVYGNLRLWKNEKVDFILTGDHTYLGKEMTLNHPTVFVRNSLYRKYGMFREDLRCAMDYELLLRFMLQGCRFQHIPEVLANMRWDGLSDANWRLGCRETLAIKNEYFPGNATKNRIYYLKHVSAIGFMKFLERSHMRFVVQWYRSQLSRIKKIYE